MQEYWEPLFAIAEKILKTPRNEDRFYSLSQEFEIAFYNAKLEQLLSLLKIAFDNKSVMEFEMFRMVFTDLNNTVLKCIEAKNL